MRLVLDAVKKVNSWITRLAINDERLTWWS